MSDVLTYDHLTRRFEQGRSLFLDANDSSRAALIENMVTAQADMLNQLETSIDIPGSERLADLGQTTLSLYSLQKEQADASEKLQEMTNYSLAEFIGRRVSAQVIPGSEDPITRFQLISGGSVEAGRFFVHETDPHPTSVTGRIKRLSFADSTLAIYDERLRRRVRLQHYEVKVFGESSQPQVSFRFLDGTTSQF
jgi:hypothetical protein